MRAPEFWNADFFPTFPRPDQVLRAPVGFKRGWKVRPRNSSHLMLDVETHILTVCSVVTNVCVRTHSHAMFVDAKRFKP